LLAPENSRFQEKRSPMELVGARKFGISGKEVTNRAHWHLKIRDSRKRGHQYGSLTPENPKKPKKKLPIVIDNVSKCN
jgi:hypothetical protein